jgi:hypothetical protein
LKEKQLPPGMLEELTRREPGQTLHVRIDVEPEAPEVDDSPEPEIE